jgi:hypothetical protein
MAVRILGVVDIINKTSPSFDMELLLHGALDKEVRGINACVENCYLDTLGGLVSYVVWVSIVHLLHLYDPLIGPYGSTNSQFQIQSQE